MGTSVRLPGAAGLVVGAAMLALSVTSAGPASAQSRSEQCAKTLEKQYGAAEVGNLQPHRSRQRKSVYTDITLSNGETARVRCRFAGGSVSSVETYVPRPFGSATPGSQWVPADDLRAEPKPEKDTGKKDSQDQAKAPAQPDESQQEPPPEPQFGVRKQPPKS